MKLSKEIGRRILVAREALNLTHADVAHKAGLSASYIGMLERGDRLPALDKLVLIARGLDLPVAYFVEHDHHGLVEDGLAFRRVKAFATIVTKLNLKPEDVEAVARLAATMYGGKA